MKRIIYIIAFTVLGILFQFLVHALIETGYISVLELDFPRYSLGLTWSQLMIVHKIFTAVLFVAGAVFGYIQGKYWWKQLYILKRYKKDLKPNF